MVVISIIIIITIIIICNYLITKRLIARNNYFELMQMKINHVRISRLEEANKTVSNSLDKLMEKYLELIEESQVENIIYQQANKPVLSEGGKQMLKQDFNHEDAAKAVDIIEKLVAEKNVLIKSVDQVRIDLEMISSEQDPVKKRKEKKRLDARMKKLQAEISEYQIREKQLLENIIPS